MREDKRLDVKIVVEITAVSYTHLALHHLYSGHVGFSIIIPTGSVLVVQAEDRLLLVMAEDRILSVH